MNSVLLLAIVGVLISLAVSAPEPNHSKSSESSESFERSSGIGNRGRSSYDLNGGRSSYDLNRGKSSYDLNRVNDGVDTILRGVGNSRLSEILRGSFLFTRNNNVRRVSSSVLDSIFGPRDPSIYNGSEGALFPLRGL